MSARPTLPAAEISPAVSELLHALQAQVLREARAVHEREAALPVLQATGEVQVRFASICGDRALCVQSTDYFTTADRAASYDCTLYAPHVVEREHLSWFTPGMWYGQEARVDQHGRTWSRHLHLVVDDFGTLVPVDGAQ